MNAKLKKVLNVVLNIFIWIFVAFSLLVTIMTFSATSDPANVPSLAGRCFLFVESPSMKPLFVEGDLIIGQKLTQEEANSLEVGDVITFYADLDNDGTKERNTHRIVAYTDKDGVRTYETQGDNRETNPVKDWYKTESSLVICQFTGTVVPGLGNFLKFLQSSTGFLLLIVLPLALFFGFELYRFIKTVLEIKGPKRKITAEDEEEIKKKAVEEYLKQLAQAKAAQDAMAATANAAPVPQATPAPESSVATEETPAPEVTEDQPKTE